MTDLQVEFLILAILLAGAIIFALLLRRKKPVTLQPDGEILVVPNEEDGTTELHFRLDPNLIEAGAEQIVLQVRRQ